MNPDTQRLLSHLHRGGNFGYYWLVSVAKNQHGQPVEKRTVWYENEPPPIPAERNGHGPRHIYFGVNPASIIPSQRTSNDGTVYRPNAAKVRPELGEIAAINCLYGDFDAKDFGNNKAATLDRIEELGEYSIPAPSALVDSGGGYQPYWLLDEPFILDTPEKRERARRLQERWVKLIGSDDSVTDLPRVLRLPGTTNFKYDHAPRCDFVYADFERLYTIDELEALLPPETPPETPIPIKRGVAPSSDHLRRWVDERIDIACNHIATAPKGAGSDERYDMGRLAGGVAHTGVYSDNEIIDMLMPYALRRSTDSAKETERNLWNGLKQGKLDPLPIPTFPTTHALILRGPWAHCPACDGFIARSKFPYPGTSENGWYCPSCKGEMKWPLDAYTPPAGAARAEVTPLAQPRPTGTTYETMEEHARRTLMHADQLAGLPPTVWLIDGVLPTNKISVWFGPGGIGKSFTVLDVALTVAQFANVIYVAAEDAEDLEIRKQAWKEHHKLSAGGLYVWPEPLRLADLNAVDAFISEALPLRPALIVIDPLADCMRGLNERDEEGMGAAVEAMNRIRRATQAAILAIHHTGWSVAHERGSSLLRGAARVVVRVDKDEDDLITVSCEKINGGKRFAKRFFRLLPVSSTVVPIPAVRVLGGGAITEKHLDVLEFLSLTINSAGVRHTDIVKHFEMPAATVTRMLNKFIERELVSRKPKGNSELYTIAENGRDLVEHRQRGTDAEEGRKNSGTRVERLNWQVEAGAIPDEARAFYAPQGDAPPVYQPLDGYDLAPDESGTSAEQPRNTRNNGSGEFHTSSAAVSHSDAGSSAVFHTSSTLLPPPVFVPSASLAYISKRAEETPEQDMKEGAAAVQPLLDPFFVRFRDGWFEVVRRSDGAVVNSQETEEAAETVCEMECAACQVPSPTAQTFDELCAGLSVSRRMSLRSLLRSSQEQPQIAARRMCEQHGISYEAARALVAPVPVEGETS